MFMYKSLIISKVIIKFVSLINLIKVLNLALNAREEICDTSDFYICNETTTVTQGFICCI